MTALLGSVIVLGLLDSLNPTTIAVAVFLATTEHPVKRLLAYAVGVYAVYFIGGVIVMLGSSELVESLLHRHPTAIEYWIYIAIGVAALVLAVVLWRKRKAGVDQQMPRAALHPASTFALGAFITLVDLPTAFPYLAAIALVIRGDVSVPGEILLLAVFNALYILPLLLVLGIYLVMRGDSESLLVRLRKTVIKVAPLILAGITLLTGIVMIGAGVRGLLRG